MLADLPQGCDRGSKTNARGYKESWNGYKLHLDTAGCGVIISAVTTSASVHDSRVCMRLSRISDERARDIFVRAGRRGVLLQGFARRLAQPQPRAAV
jgi:hypothetical protein